MPSFHVEVALEGIREMLVTEVAVERVVAVYIVVPKTVGIAEFNDMLTVAATKVAR